MFNVHLGIKCLISSHEISTSTLSNPSFALANKWLNECSVKHSICRRLDEKPRPWYPARLLDVGQLDGAWDVRLRICATEPPTGSYLSLSHCWGSARLLKLKFKNIELMKAGISLGALPKTFRDAVLITRKLGVQYVWIDALCIIQDSVEDWRKEVVTMGNVYKNALCNIAATGALDSSIGCFWDRNPLLVQPCKLDFTWELPFKGSYYCVDGSLWPKNIGEAPLNHRAWVTQERILSPRVLHFGMQQIFWECLEVEACESFPGGIPKTSDPMTFIVRTGLKRMRSVVSPDIPKTGSETLAESYMDGYEYWDGILDVYTRSSLTRPEDKLIALSGLAKEMSVLLNDEYLAGLWKNRLASQLLWSVNKPNTSNSGHPCFRPPNYRAPTWSWASLEGHIVTGNRAPDTFWGLLPSLLEAHITPIGNDHTGQVSEGHLQIQGILRPVTWQCLWSGRIYAILLDGRKPDYSTFWPDEVSALPDEEEEVYCFPILDRDKHDEYAGNTRTVDGLVLAKNAAGKTKNEFRRIGCFRYQDEEDCWLLMKRRQCRDGSSSASGHDHPNYYYVDLEEQSFTII